MNSLKYVCIHVRASVSVRVYVGVHIRPCVCFMHNVCVYKGEGGTVLLRIHLEEKWACNAEPLPPPQSSDCTHQS